MGNIICLYTEHELHLSLCKQKEKENSITQPCRPVVLSVSTGSLCSEEEDCIHLFPAQLVLLHLRFRTGKQYMIYCIWLIRYAHHTKNSRVACRAVWQGQEHEEKADFNFENISRSSAGINVPRINWCTQNSDGLLDWIIDCTVGWNSYKLQRTLRPWLQSPTSHDAIVIKSVIITKGAATKMNTTTEEGFERAIKCFMCNGTRATSDNLT